MNSTEDDSKKAEKQAGIDLVVLLKVTTQEQLFICCMDLCRRDLPESPEHVTQGRAAHIIHSHSFN